MNTKTSGTKNGRSHGAVADVRPLPQDPWAVWSRQQMQAMNQVTSALLDGADKLRHCQLEAGCRAKLQHQKGHAQIDASASTSELAQAQAELMGADLQAAVAYWQDLWGICMATQVDLLSRTSSGLGAAYREAQASMLPAAAQLAKPTAEGGAGAVDNPAAQVWKNWLAATETWRSALHAQPSGTH